jgi:hypothetical protein
VHLADDHAAASAAWGKSEIERPARPAAEESANHHFLSPTARQRTSAAVPDLFDMHARRIRRDRAARSGAELFLYERAFEDCMERIALIERRFARAVLTGCPDPAWPGRLSAIAGQVDVRDPGPRFAERAGGEAIIEDAWQPAEGVYDLVLAVGTLDSVNSLPLALRLIRYSMRPDALFIGALSGGDTLPQLRNAMRAADKLAGVAAPHIHPRIEPSALAPLLADAGFIRPVVDVDRVAASYSSLERLVSDVRRMGATNVLTARPRFVGRSARSAAARAFAEAGDGSRTVETFEILHFAALTAANG